MEFLTWIEESSIGVHVREDAWTFAVMLCMHSVGMAASLGLTMMLIIIIMTGLRQAEVSR